MIFDILTYLLIGWVAIRARSGCGNRPLFFVQVGDARHPNSRNWQGGGGQRREAVPKPRGYYANYRFN